MKRSKIEWTDATWNPMTGCTKLSEGCANCYAERIGKRHFGGFEPKICPERIDQPKHLRMPRRVFVCSMGDLFHEAVPEWYIHEVFSVMRECKQHTFQVLTKRAIRMRNLNLAWPDNAWAGTSVEDWTVKHRIEALKQVDARVRFVSLEPLLETIGYLDLSGVHWVIVGGESGPGARRMDAEWVRSIRDQCVQANVPFFFKQWGGVNKREAGSELDGRTWKEFPRQVAPACLRPGSGQGSLFDGE